MKKLYNLKRKQATRIQRENKQNQEEKVYCIQMIIIDTQIVLVISLEDIVFMNNQQIRINNKQQLRTICFIELYKNYYKLLKKRRYPFNFKFKEINELLQLIENKKRVSNQKNINLQNMRIVNKKNKLFIIFQINDEIFLNLMNRNQEIIKLKSLINQKIIIQILNKNKKFQTSI
ncbi:unnamed protein product [Paramecium sonneborni]|uniref:Uncharacterized protein n=1 Tax=Paramecium sonneborni TaxID=65129 RepID=A0A8S1MRQ4_9CILI|nr:unnamed protein product [Paramecium sonneborni]